MSERARQVGDPVRIKWNVRSQPRTVMVYCCQPRKVWHVPAYVQKNGTAICSHCYKRVKVAW